MNIFLPHFYYTLYYIKYNFFQFVGQGDGSEFIIPCENLDGLDGDPSTMLSNFIVRVSMGTVRDYYRPDPSAKTSNKNGIDLCYLLTL